MFKERSLRGTLIFLFLVASLIPIIIVSFIGFKASEKNMKEEIFRGWSLVYNMTKNELEDFFAGKEKECNILANAKEVAEGVLFLKWQNWNTSSILWEEKKKAIDQVIADVSPLTEDDYFLITNPEGRIIYATREEDLGKNVFNQPYFKPALEGQPTWTDIFYSEGYGKNIKLYASPIYSDRNRYEVIGVMISFVPNSFLTKLVHGEIASVSDTADAYLIDKHGLLYTDSHKMGDAGDLNTYIDIKAVGILAPIIEAQDEEFLMKEMCVSLDGEKSIGIGGYTRLGDEDFGFIIQLDFKEVLGSLDKMRNLILVVSVVIIILLIAFTLRYSKYITSPIIDLTALMAKAEVGDLTVRINIKRKDELGRLANSFNGLMEGTCASINAIMSASNIVEEAADDISRSTQEMADGTQLQSSSIEELTATMEEMSASIQDVSENVQDTADFSENVSKAMVEMNVSIHDVLDNAQLVAQEMDLANEAIRTLGQDIQGSSKEAKATEEEMNRAVDMTQAGSKQVEKTIEEMDSIDLAVGNLARAINELGESAAQIGDIVEVIDDIAEQTNLLALNAAIEAARAGEHGKGFAVVASAIGDLANKSQEATQDIGKLIKGIQSEVEEAIRTTDDGTKIVRQGVDSVQRAGLAFRDIHSAVSDVTAKINKITDMIAHAVDKSEEVQSAVANANTLALETAEATKEQAANATEIVKMVEKMSELSREVAATSEEQAASSDEIVRAAENVGQVTTQNSAASEEIASSSEELKKLAESLLEIVNRFKLT